MGVTLVRKPSRFQMYNSVKHHLHTGQGVGEVEVGTLGLFLWIWEGAWAVYTVSGRVPGVLQPVGGG